MLKVHHLELSRSTRVVWALEELGVPYEIVRYARTKQFLAPPELERIHPLGKSPVIDDDGTIVAESGNILEYLVEKFDPDGKLAPAPGSKDYREFRYFMHYAEGSLMPYLVMKLVMNKVKTTPMPFFVKPIARKISDGVQSGFIDPNLTRHFAFLGKHLEGRQFIVGDALTIADIQMSFPAMAAVERGAELGVPASLTAYVERLKARPAYQRAVEKAGS